MTENWRNDYLAESVRRKLCTKIHCTTCGAREFRLGVLRTMSENQGIPPQTEYDGKNVVEIAKALAGIRPGESIRFIRRRSPVFARRSFEPYPDLECRTLQRSRWNMGGRIARKMEDHENARTKERRARDEYEDPVNIQKRRDEKKRLKAERHRERLEQKKERDRLWRNWSRQ
ncbi:MAG: hypothetical protein IPK01_00560 [Acidobacteria bacterium]|nr:hypothetical protein [Acidobacteriota bacterium]